MLVRKVETLEGSDEMLKRSGEMSGREDEMLMSECGGMETRKDKRGDETRSRE